MENRNRKAQGFENEGSISGSNGSRESVSALVHELAVEFRKAEQRALKEERRQKAQGLEDIIMSDVPEDLVREFDDVVVKTSSPHDRSRIIQGLMKQEIRRRRGEPDGTDDRENR